jgi:N-acetylglucosamine kinase-like BadF-type ATPase
MARSKATTRYALGIDGGGSKCDAALMTESGAVVAWGRGGPTHIYYDPPEVISASYVQAITGALAGIEGAAVWAAGPLPEGAPRAAVTAHNELAFHLPANEVDTAFASAQKEWGVIVLAGTGSFVYARAPDGRALHFGGRGPILGDQGSAYAIGLLGLRAAFASGWTNARRTSLASAIPEALGVADLNGVFDLVYVQQITRRQIAALAKVVDAQAEGGDQVAAACLCRAADELAEMAAEAVTELGIGGLSFPAIAIGGVARNSRIWWDRVCQRLSAVAAGMTPLVPPVVPAVGAGLLALRRMGVPWNAELIALAHQTASEFMPPSH